MNSLLIESLFKVYLDLFYHFATQSSPFCNKILGKDVKHTTETLSLDTTQSEFFFFNLKASFLRECIFITSIKTNVFSNGTVLG